MFRPMRDPRLAEVEFLMDVEQRRSFQLRARLADTEERYGLDAAVFHDMVIELLLRGHLAGPAFRTDGGSLSSATLRNERDDMLARFGAGHAIAVQLSHSGRVQMWSLRDELLRDADREPMGLKNKAAWERDLLLRLRWAVADEPLSIIILDLDNFGIVNKQLGMSVGDDVLRATFDLLKNVVGTCGDVYRYGGEEVGILLPGLGLDAASALADELRALIETEVARRVPALGRAQTASIGVGSFTSSVDPRTAVNHVDELMRQAKQAGKNRVTSKAFEKQPPTA